MSTSSRTFQRAQGGELSRRLLEPRRFLQVVAGPRQVGKTTLVQAVVEESGLSVRYTSADEPALRGTEWIAQQWDIARLNAAKASSDTGFFAFTRSARVDGKPGWPF